MNVIDFPGAFPEQLCRQGCETLTDPEERRQFAKMLRMHVAMLTAEHRALTTRQEYIRKALDRCESLILPLTAAES